MPIFTPYHRARILLIGATVLCFAAFWWVGHWFRIPIDVSEQASLLQQPSPVLALLIVAVTFVCCVVMGTAIAGVIRFNAGLLAAAAGLSAISFRGGTMRTTIFWGLANGSGNRLFLHLAMETLILGLLIGVCWWAMRLAHMRGLINDREGRADPDESVGAGQQISAITVQTLATALGVMLLTPAEAKHQVLAAVFLSSLAASVIVQYLLPSSSRGWHWAAPFLVGAMGYALAWYDPAGMQTATLSGTFASLARPLPLDYASAGPVGAIIGHWLARRWQRHEES